MPILAKTPDIYPANLLELAGGDEQPAEARWWALYTRSRQEKKLMHSLADRRIPFYSPLIERRYRSPNGRVRTSYQPLFPNYVFLFGDESNRYQSLTTNCVSKWFEVQDSQQMVADLQAIARLIQIGRPLTPEAKLKPGDRVRVKSGAFAGFEGTILKRRNETRLVVAVTFLQQGASVQLDDCQLAIL